MIKVKGNWCKFEGNMKSLTTEFAVAVNGLSQKIPPEILKRAFDVGLMTSNEVAAKMKKKGLN